MNRHPTAVHAGRRRGFMLIDCLVYIGLLAVLLALSYEAFYHALDHSRDLTRNAADIARALQAGERWRADVRAASAAPRQDVVDGAPVLHLLRAGGAVLYRFHEGAVLRRDSSQTNAGWLPFLPAVRASQMVPEARQRVTAWRWELELESRQASPRVRPLFTFQAVPAMERKP